MKNYQYEVKVNLTAVLSVAVTAKSPEEAEEKARHLAEMRATQTPALLRNVEITSSDLMLVKDEDCLTKLDKYRLREDLYDIEMSLFNRVTSSFPYQALRNVEKVLLTHHIIDPKNTGHRKTRSTVYKARLFDPGYRVWSLKRAIAEYRRLIAKEELSGDDLNGAPLRRRKVATFIRHQLRAADISYQICKGDMDKIGELIDNL